VCTHVARPRSHMAHPCVHGRIVKKRRGTSQRAHFQRKVNKLHLACPPLAIEGNQRVLNCALHGGLIRRCIAYPAPKKFFPTFMQRRHNPAFYSPTLYLFRNQSVTYPSCRPSIRTLIRRIEALGYEVVILPRDIEWADIPQEYWGVQVTINNTLLFVVPLPCQRHLLTRSGVFFGNYEEV
jgi:hypothetical protein